MLIQISAILVSEGPTLLNGPVVLKTIFALHIFTISLCIIEGEKCDHNFVQNDDKLIETMIVPNYLFTDNCTLVLFSFFHPSSQHCADTISSEFWWSMEVLSIHSKSILKNRYKCIKVLSSFIQTLGIIIPLGQLVLPVLNSILPC